MLDHRSAIRRGGVQYLAVLGRGTRCVRLSDQCQHH
jgi:hypothetical protein